MAFGAGPRRLVTAHTNASRATPVTLRQLHYRLVSQEGLGYLNTRADYNKLSGTTTAARRAGTFPGLLDRGRGIEVPFSWTCPQDAQEWLRRRYRRDRTEGQEWTIYLAVEKAGLVEQLDEWFSTPYGIPILPLGGYHSESFEREIFTHANTQGRPSVLLYAGDLDASGEDIERNFRAHLHFDEFKRVALTEAQAVQFDLPPLIGKRADPRAASFTEKYGRLFQIELDALDPDVLRALFTVEVNRYWNEATYLRALDREAEERASLRP